MYKKITLKNGLRVITVPKRGTKAATVLVLIGTGSKYEVKKMSGISHFLEHMFFKGTKKYPNPIHLAEIIDGVGGVSNAFTTGEWTGYYAGVNSQHVDMALQWSAEILLHSLFPAKEIRKEKGVIIEEINMYRNNPASHIDTLWEEVLYGDQPAGWNVAGTKETVAHLTRKNLVEYMEQQYVASNTVICVAGNINEEEVLGTIKKLFGTFKTGEPRTNIPVSENQTKPHVLCQFQKTEQTNIALGVRAYNTFDEKHYIQDILATILGGMMSSRLFDEVREKKGLTYDISTFSESNTDTGWVASFAGITNKNIDEAIRIILREYRKLQKEKVSQKELEKAKEHIVGQHILRMESSSTAARFYGLQELLERNISTPEEEYAKIRAVTAQDVQHVAKDIFRPEKLNLALIGPFRDRKHFEKLLKL